MNSVRHQYVFGYYRPVNFYAYRRKVCVNPACEAQ